MRLFRALLRLFPLEFRSVHGREMEQVFREQQREREQDGRFGVLALWTEAALDVLRTAPAQHLAMLKQDVAYALRTMSKERSFALAAVLVLACGIGANSAIFGVVHAVMLKPLPFAEPDRLYFLWGDHPRIGHEEASLPDFVDWRAQNDVFEDLAAIATRNVTFAGRGDAERVLGARVSDSFFRVLGVPPARGRGFTRADDRPGAARVVVLGDGLWRRRFGADPAVVGQAVTIDGLPFTVIGVAPPGWAFPREVEAWTPLAMAAGSASRRGDFLQVIGRLRSGTTAAHAAAEMRTIASRLERQYPDTNRRWSVALVQAHEQLVGKGRRVLVALWGSVGFLLLVACTNVANLLLARGASRAREMAIRAALGAGRTRLFRQAMTESVVFSGLGGILGLILARYGIALLIRFGPADTPRLQEAGLHPAVVAFTVLIALATGIIFGLVPASRVGVGLHGALQQDGRATGGRAGKRLGLVLVAVQVALSLILLSGAGLMARSFVAITAVDPGFRTDHLLTFRLALPAANYGADPAIVGFYERLLEGLRSQPGVRSADATSSLYLAGTGAPINSYSVEGRPDPPPDQESDAHIRVVSVGLHRTLGVRIVRGRDFTEADDASAPRAVVVNESLANRVFGKADPVGHRVSMGAIDGRPDWRQIVGVAADVRQDGLDERVYPEIQLPLRQAAQRSMTVVIRTDLPPASLASVVREQVRKLDARVPVFALRTADQAVAETVATRRFGAWLLGTFAVIALLLASAGLYAVAAYRVERSRQEIGVRMALGASRGAIVRMVLGQGLLAALAGLGSGLPLALLVTGYLRGLLFGVAPGDPATFGAMALLLLFTSAAACYLPARRATRIDPLVALRAE